ncbi:related to Serine/threonine-protein kinase YPK2/YKR2 [Saccharomycodes ludwigii]|uniref:non-specific serine/threonine protein kinase n=1 Tax=Saccharomycodes ludwigii TaxID=36035 RepID=A0A376B861_9ASCO|nr:hypothetical protein SCDLUD_004016 [Saccharomycodes ludwigii]KAH3899730.1 hypothetical protein SCDLUD_004016 [Saccharomycodes ludwigii]SSD60811.1 related to Serine/threonine-protein kinase YPK2/YKR2 [Saccharomycodes ludwigii]
MLSVLKLKKRLSTNSINSVQSDSSNTTIRERSDTESGTDLGTLGTNSVFSSTNTIIQCTNNTLLLPNNTDVRIGSTNSSIGSSNLIKTLKDISPFQSYNSINTKNNKNNDNIALVISKPSDEPLEVNKHEKKRPPLKSDNRFPRNNTDTTTSDDTIKNQNTNTSVAGILNLKIYSGNNIKLPQEIKYDTDTIAQFLSINNQTELLKKFKQKHFLETNEIETENINITGSNLTKYLPCALLNTNLIFLTIECDGTIATITPVSGVLYKPLFNKLSSFDINKQIDTIKIDVYCRDLISREKNYNGITLLDSFEIPLNLNFEYVKNTVRLYNHKWLKFQYGKINISMDFTPQKTGRLCIDDFDLLKVIGKGSFGKVMQVRKKDTNKIYALKAIRKTKFINNKSEIQHILAERTILAMINNPFIVSLKFSFQSKDKLYLVLPFIPGGELFYHLSKCGRFSTARSRFYIAELLCAIEGLHKMDVIYRDLKPENVLLDHQGHIALCDFGLCKLNMKDDSKTNTFCGTSEYLAPELILRESYTKIVDWWTLGVVLYEMLIGQSPYHDENVSIMYKRILNDPLKFEDPISTRNIKINEDAKDLIIKLLNRNPLERLGCKNGAQDIKSHAFFKNIDWDLLIKRKYIPPFVPNCGTDDNSTGLLNFDSEFTMQKPVDSLVENSIELTQSIQEEFGGWTYAGK